MFAHQVNFKSEAKFHYHKVSIHEALITLRTGVLAFGLCEYYDLKLTNIIGITPSFIPTIFFDSEGFDKVIQKKQQELSLIINTENQTAIVPIPGYDVNLLISKNISQRFPSIKKILDSDQYSNISSTLEDGSLVDRCKRMLKMWQEWCTAGLPHLVSSLQALQRQLASKMKNPLIQNEFKNENGLSTEYQCEIYSNHLYGAKLLEAWHHYLMSSVTSCLNPHNFLNWLTLLSQDDLSAYGIKDLKDIPKVHYITDDSERSTWLLQFGSQNSVSNSRLPKPQKLNEEIEIIFTLGKSKSASAFFGGIKTRGTINHSSFFGEQKVESAGRMLLKANYNHSNELIWIIHEINDNSGHIKPDDKMALRMLERLQELGLNLKTIFWHSKWSTKGVCNETADMALKRFSKVWESVTHLEIQPVKLTDFFKKLKEYTKMGALGALQDLLDTQGHSVSQSDSMVVSSCIKEALENHLRLYQPNIAHSSIVNDLAKSALEYLRNIGKNSQMLEDELAQLVKCYENNKGAKYKRFN